MPDIQSRPYRVNERLACELCCFGRGEHAEWCGDITPSFARIAGRRGTYEFSGSPVSADSGRTIAAASPRFAAKPITRGTGLKFYGGACGGGKNIRQRDMIAAISDGKAHPISKRDYRIPFSLR